MQTLFDSYSIARTLADVLAEKARDTARSLDKTSTEKYHAEQEAGKADREAQALATQVRAALESAAAMEAQIKVLRLAAQNLVEFTESALRNTVHHDDAEYFALAMRAALISAPPLVQAATISRHE